MWHRLQNAMRCLFRGNGRFKHEVERDDGWTDWIHPAAPIYKLECCDCGLVHDMVFKIAPSEGIVPDESLNEGESQDAVIWFAARRE